MADRYDPEPLDPPMTPFLVTEVEMNIIETYRCLTESGQEAVIYTLQSQVFKALDASDRMSPFLSGVTEAIRESGAEHVKDVGKERLSEIARNTLGKQKDA